MELFGWQGFSLEHREDWCPELLTGNRHAGLVRIGGPGGQIQIKWQANRKAPNLQKSLRDYLRQLERHCRKASLPFSFDTSGDEKATGYSWKSEIYGLGHFHFDEQSRRVFLIESSGPKREAASKALDLAVSSFQTSRNGAEIWSLNGLKVLLPRPLELKSWKLVSGRTQLTFMGPKVVATAGRSAFANEVLGGSTVHDWAVKLAGGGVVEADGPGLRIESVRRRWGMTIASTTLVKVSEDSNEIKHLSVMRRGEEWRPDWTWLEC